MFIGGGYISMEFAHVVARFGSKVTVIDHHARPLKGFDPDLVDQLTRWSTGIGIQFICGSRVEAVSREKNGTLQVVTVDAAVEPDGGHLDSCHDSGCSCQLLPPSRRARWKACELRRIL